jgi:allophycocyanin alpha subunit
MLMLKLVTSGLGELDRIKAFVTSGAARLRIAETLTGARKTIVKQAGDRLFQKRPDIVSPVATLTAKK